MKISIDPKILENFPDAKIGWLRAGVADAGGAAHVRALKAGLEARLNDIGISADTMMMHPDVRRWREVYSAMGVKPSKYRSSLEALLRRIFKGDLWEVSPVVDCYDCVSALSLLPMGAHDMEKLRGGLTLRYAREGEKFYPLGAGDSVVESTPTAKKSAAGSGTTATRATRAWTTARKRRSSSSTAPSRPSGAPSKKGFRRSPPSCPR